MKGFACVFKDYFVHESTLKYSKMKKVINIIALALLFASCSMKAKESETTINVIPYPQSVEVGKGTFKGAGANFNCDQAIDANSQEIIK